MFFGGAWIFGGWGAVGWGCKSYLGPAEIVSFSSRSFSYLNQIWFKCETRLLFFLNFITYHLISSRPQIFFKIGIRKILLISQENICVLIIEQNSLLLLSFLKNTSGGCFCTYCTHMTSHAIWVDEIRDIIVSIKKINKS